MKIKNSSSIFALFLFLLFSQQKVLANVPLSANIADWAKHATVGGFSAYPQMTDQQIIQLMTVRQNENVSILEVDSGLSNYLNTSEFQDQVNFLDRVGTLAHERDMKAVIYIPSLEVNTPDGETLPNSMYKDHPDWVQHGIDGTPNAFYGSQEVWVEPGMESAWMSPNTGYKDYFISRIQQLAATNLDGVWLDVPIYLGTGTAWAGAEPAAAADFNAWSIEKGLGGANGYQVPTQVDWDSPVFRAWVIWRHENLAGFLNDVRIAAQQVNPDFMVIVENFPTDYMDGTDAGLDGNYRISTENFLRVYEIDSVSNTKAMQWASVDEFSNKITMYKWARGVDRENPSWAFSYGFQPLDAGLTMGAAISTGVVPFESQTPNMVETVDSSFRSQWFGFVQQNHQALLDTPRHANVGIWYSSATRDFLDSGPGRGGYGMYATTENPNNDPDWWATEPADSFLIKPHMGGYRGAAHALIKLHVPFKVVADPGVPASELSNIKFLWLPSVAAISDESATIIKNFVANGGTVFASGNVPGSLDEWGNPRTTNILQDLFDFTDATSPVVNMYGNGVAIFNPSVRGVDMFSSLTDPVKANKDLSTVEQLVRIHVNDDLVVNAPEGVHVEIGKASNTQHHLYILNYSGLQLPLVSSPQDVTIDYRAPDGYRVASASSKSPDGNTQTGGIAVTKSAEQYYRITLNVDQFSLVTLTLVPDTNPTDPPLPTPTWSTALRQEAAESGLDFILNSMRHSNAPIPMRYGVYTNLINDSGLTEIYAHGHHVTAEHMGLILRASSCMGNTSAYQQSYQFVKELMVDPLYSVVNWAIDRDRHKPLVEYIDPWINSNAPLDDFRVIRGILNGMHYGQTDSDDLAKALLNGMYWTSITDRDHKSQLEFPAYPEGLVGYAWDWSGTTDPTLTPPAVATGLGGLFTDPIPTDYNDLYMMGQGARFNPRWKSVLASATDLLLDSEVSGSPGLFYNGYQSNGVWTGDFENRDTNQGLHLKSIQTLWIALHLAQASEFSIDILDATRASNARSAAQRSLSFFKSFYLANNRVPEHLTFAGNDVPLCTGPNVPNGCLIPGEEHLHNGEARIYALLARLALFLGDPSFASQLIEQKILTDRIDDTNDPRYGLIGLSTTTAGNAEAWNVLESVLTLCLEATYDQTNASQAPVAIDQTVTVMQEASVGVTLNATDPNQDSLTYQVVSQPSSGTLSGIPPNLTYTPNSGYHGADFFTFKANDGQFDSNVGVVSLSVTPLPVVNTAPVAQGQNLDIFQDTAASVTLLAVDPQDDPLTYTVTSNPNKGALTGTAPNLVYTPNNGVSGNDSFTFKASDGELESNEVTVNIVIHAAGSPVVISNQISTITVDGNLSDWSGISTFGLDPDDVTGTNNKLDWLEGAMAHNNSNLYIVYRNDGSIDTSNGWGWQLYIDADNNPNTGYALAFGAIGAEYHIEENMVRSYIGNGDTWEWQGVGAAHSAVSGDFAELMVPRAWIGNPASFKVAFYGENVAFPGGTTEDYYPDGLFDSQASIRNFQYSFETNNNQAPTANDLNISVLQDDSVSFVLTGNDPDQDTLTYAIVSQPNSGTLSGTAPNLVYTPNAGYSGSDSFTFKVNDGQLDSNTATVNITVSPVVVNTPPVADSQSVVTAENSPISIELTASDQDGDSLTYTVFNPTNGVLTGFPPNLIYTPDNDFVGSDSFSFKVNDGELDSNEATVSITVQGTNNGTVSNPVNSIQVDGNLTDWASLTSFGADPNDVTGAENKLDWLEGWAAHSTDNLYIAYKNDGAIDQSAWWAWQIYIDSDNNPATGYRVGPFGADYSIQSGTVWKYTGSGSDWSWQSEGSITSAIQNDVVEYEFPLAWIGNPNKFRIIFYGENSAFPGGTTTDLYPDGFFDDQASVRFFEYSLNEEQNNAPVAESLNVSLQKNSIKDINLTVSDPDGDELSFNLVTAPSHGNIELFTSTGVGMPDITYIPNTDYVGSDSFTYKVNDGGLDSNVATVNITVIDGAPVVSNPSASIQVDGNLSEWASLTSFGTDPNDVSGAENVLDWMEGWAAHNATNFYLAYRNEGAIDVSGWWAWQTYLDTDDNSATGYSLGSVGAEYSIESGNLWKYTGTGFDWSWQHVGQVNVAVDANSVEYGIQRTMLDNPSSLRVIFYGENSAFVGGTTIDLYPDGIFNNQATIRYFQYSLQ